MDNITINIHRIINSIIIHIINMIITINPIINIINKDLGTRLHEESAELRGGPVCQAACDAQRGAASRGALPVARTHMLPACPSCE